MPIGTAVHQRHLALCESLNFREWSGYVAVSAYEAHHEHEYNAIRHAAALIDLSPLFKYAIHGRDATRLVDRVITRDATKMDVGQVFYTPWCDERGAVIDDGTVTRLGDSAYRWTAADPNYRWLRQNACGLDVEIDDISDRMATLGLQGPMSAQVLRAVFDAESVAIDALKYFRLTRGTIGGVPVEISRTGYTGDLGYEIWIAWDGALAVWDAIVGAGRAHDLHPCGMLALDVARIEAGLLLLDVDFVGCRKAIVPAQRYSPYEMSLDRLVQLDKARFVGQRALRAERARGARRRIVGLEIRWSDVEALCEREGLPPTAPSAASRVAVPLYAGGVQVGKATSTTWSPTLKKMIAIATVSAGHAATGTRLEFEYTIEAVRHRVGAEVVKTPFFNPPRKTAMPPG